MQDQDILKQLKQPKLLLDIAAGSLSILGVFGCFSDFQIIKQLSMGAVIGGGIGLGTSALMAELYAKTAANALERDLLRKQSAVDAVSRKANDLETEVESWKLRHSQAELKVETLENSLDTLTREVIQSRQSKATMEVTLGEFQARLSIASDELNQAQARISLISSEFASNAKITLNQAVSDWKSNLTNALDASLKKRPDLQPQLSKLRGEVTALCDGHLNAIAQLSHRGNLNQFADEAFTLLWQAASEISSLKVRHKNTLSVGEVRELRTRVEELESADVISRSDYERVIGNYKSLVDEFRIQKDEIVTGILDHAESLKTEIDTDHDAYVNQLIQQLEKATQQIAELKKAHRFPGVTEQSRVGNSIIEYYSRFGFILDALDWDDSECGYRLMFYVGRNPRFISAEMLNDGDLPEKLKELTGAIALPKFAYSTRGGHVVLEVQTRKAKKRDTSEADINRLWVPAAQFEKTVKGWSRVRLTGGSESGKSPTAENLAVAILKHRPGVPKLFNPQHDSVKNHWSIPVVGTSHKDSEKGIKALAEQVDARANGQETRDTFEISIFDEIDSTMSHTKGKKAVIGGHVNFIIKQASHQNLGAIFIGQNANASEYPGMDRSDWNSAVNVHIGANAYDAIENSNRFTSDEQAKLKKTADRLTEFCTAKNEELSLDKTDPNAYRFALVIEPNKKPYFIELPAFGTYSYDQCPQQGRGETEASMGVTPMTTGAYVAKVSERPDPSRHPGMSGVETSRDTSDKPACPYCKSDKVRSKGDSWLCQNPDHYLLASGTPKSWKK